MIYTLDDAREAFTSSAIELLKTVDATEVIILALVAGDKTVAGLMANDRSLINAHTELINNMNRQGYGHAVRDEVEGIDSCVRTLGVVGALSVFVDQLEQAQQARSDYIMAV